MTLNVNSTTWMTRIVLPGMLKVLDEVSRLVCAQTNTRTDTNTKLC